MPVYCLEQTAADVPPDDHWLSSGERARLCELRIPKRRADWRLGRWTAKRAVAASLGATVPEPAGIEIRAAPSGAPQVFFPDGPFPVTISLSHRNATALCSVAPVGTLLGCDLEAIEPHSYAFVADYFTTEEQALVARTCPADRWRVVALLWSAKESALKALRVGLRMDTRCVSAAAPGRQFGEGWHPLEVRFGLTRVFHGWWCAGGELLRTVVADPPAPVPISATIRATYGEFRMLA